MGKIKTLLNRLKKYSFLLGIILFIYIIIKIDINKFYSILTTSNVTYIILGAFLAPVIMLVMALRWKFILRALKIRYRFVNVCISLIKGALLGEVTPGRLGEFFRAQYLVTETKTSPGKAVFSVVIDRIYDVAVLIIIAGTSSTILIKIYAIDIPLLAILVLSGGFFLFLVLFLNKKIVRSVLSPVFNLLISSKYQENAHFHFNEFYEGLNSMKHDTHTVCVGLSIIIWQLKFLGLYILSEALRIEVPFWFVISIGSVVTIVSLLPISASGLGTREAALILFLSFHHIPAEFAVALSFLYLVFGIWGIGMLGGIFYVYQKIITSLVEKPKKLDQTSY